jgi:hypothetical protein
MISNLTYVWNIHDNLCDAIKPKITRRLRNQDPPQERSDSFPHGYYTGAHFQPSDGLAELWRLRGPVAPTSSSGRDGYCLYRLPCSASADADADAHPYAHADAHADSRPDADADTYPHAHAHAYAHPNADAYAYAFANPNAEAEADSNPSPETRSQAPRKE